MRGGAIQSPCRVQPPPTRIGLRTAPVVVYKSSVLFLNATIVSTLCTCQDAVASHHARGRAPGQHGHAKGRAVTETGQDFGRSRAEVRCMQHVHHKDSRPQNNASCLRSSSVKAPAKSREHKTVRRGGIPGRNDTEQKVPTGVVGGQGIVHGGSGHFGIHLFHCVGSCAHNDTDAATVSTPQSHGTNLQDIAKSRAKRQSTCTESLQHP